MKILSARITEDRFSELAERIHKNAAKAVSATAEAVAIKAQLDAPVDTGALKNSIYASTFRGSGYQAAANSALGLRPDAEMLPEIGQPSNDLEALVAVGAEYGLYVEMGTSRMAARPYLETALENERAAFEQAMKDILK